MFIRRYGVAAVLAGALALASVHSAAAENGITADSITFGQAAVLEGPASALGRGMRGGIQAAFDETNARGGVHGRKLKLVSRDDGYEPDRAIAETKKLIDEDKVFALIGPVGTPTSAAAQPLATAAHVPFIGPFTGAGFLRNPKLENVINVRASYGAETEAWIKHLTEDLKVRKIAIFYQDDAFGRAGLDGVKAAMGKRGLELAGEATYERNTVAVKTALITLKRAEPEAVVMVGAYKPCAEFIRLARKIEFNPVFVNISFVGASALAKELGADGRGGGRVASRAVPVGHLAQGGGRLSRGDQERARFRLARRLSGRPARHCRAREAGRRADARGPHQGDQGHRQVRYRRARDDVRADEKRRARPGVPHGHSGRRLVQGGRQADDVSEPVIWFVAEGHAHDGR